MAALLLLGEKRYQLVAHGDPLPLVPRPDLDGFASIGPNGSVTLTENLATNPAVFLFTPYPSEGDT
jgi:hypothetical protein